MNTHIDLSILDRLARPTLLHVRQMHSVLTSNGFQCHLVGGCVRDLLLGLSVQDIDITTDARPEDVIRLFQKTIPTGLKHGTVTVLFREDKINYSYEVTTYRTESTYSDGRRPDKVEYATTIDEDLSRRDFTINAMAMEPVTGELIDNFDGRHDLENRIIKTIGLPRDRFFEDGLRPVRACRFKATLGFQIDTATLQAISQSDIRSKIQSVAIERFTDELLKGLRSKQPSAMLISLQDTDIFSLFLKGIRYMPHLFLESIDAAQSEVFRLSVWLDRSSTDPIETAKTLRLSGNIIKQIRLYSLLFRSFETGSLLKYKPNDEKSCIEERIKWRPMLAEIKRQLQSVEKSTDFLNESRSFFTGRYSTIGSKAPPHEKYMAALDDHFQWMIKAVKDEPLLITDLEISGSDLMELGITGPSVGKALQFLLEQVYADHRLNTKKLLLDMIRLHFEKS